MRVIALASGAPGAFTMGGTATVLAAGAGAGVAGALLHALSRAAARCAGGRAWVRLLIFALLLGLVTARGLRGSPAASSALFWPLVALYGLAVDRALTGRAGAARRASRPATSLGGVVP